MNINQTCCDGHVQAVQILFWLIVGLAIVPPETQAVTGPSHSDLDNNGTADLIWRNTITGDVAGWLMDGLTLTTPGVIVPAVPLEWVIGASGISTIMALPTSSGAIR